MLVIRESRKQVFESACADRAEQRLLGYFKTYFPFHWSFLGETQIRGSQR